MAKYRVAGTGFWDGSTLYPRGAIIEWGGPEGEALEPLEGERKADVQVSRASLVENWRPERDERGNKVGTNDPAPDKLNPNASVPGDPDPGATVDSTGQFDAKAASETRKKAEEARAKEAEDRARQTERDNRVGGTDRNRAPLIDDAKRSADDEDDDEPVRRGPGRPRKG